MVLESSLKTPAQARNLFWLLVVVTFFFFCLTKAGWIFFFFFFYSHHLVAEFALTASLQWKYYKHRLEGQAHIQVSENSSHISPFCLHWQQRVSVSKGL